MTTHFKNHLLASLLVGTAVWSQSLPAQDFEAGREAARQGDFATALAEWQPLAEDGNAAAQFNMGMLHARGDGVPQDYETAAKWFMMAAEQGQRDAQARIGGMYARGLGLEQNFEQAAKWLLLAAEQHHAPSQYELGILYANGQGVGRDESVAYFWFGVAAAQNYEPAYEGQKKLLRYMVPQQVEMVEKQVAEWLEANSGQIWPQ